MGGSKLSSMLGEAQKTYGADASQIKLATDYVNAAMGNREVGMSRELKDLYGAVNVYQNFRLLPFSLFNSLVDPMGIAVRTNNIGDAWGAFAYSVKNMFRDFKDEYTPDQWEQIAQDFGVIEDHGTTLNANVLYDGQTLSGTTKSQRSERLDPQQHDLRREGSGAVHAPLGRGLLRRRAQHALP
jgi:hypothetical protein